MSKNLIYKDNKIIEACYKLSLSEQRILLMAISHVNSTKKLSDTERFILSADEYSLIFSTTKKEAFRELKEAMVTLSERWVKVIDNGDTLEKVRWLSTRSSTNSTQSISFYFGSGIIKYLSQLTGEFTRYKLINVAGINSVYAIRIYEMLMRWKAKREITLTVEELKSRMELTTKAYTLFGNIKLKVIEPAMFEIKSHTDINPGYELIKKGNKVISIRFYFSYKEGLEPTNLLRKDNLAEIKRIRAELKI